MNALKRRQDKKKPLRIWKNDTILMATYPSERPPQKKKKKRVHRLGRAYAALFEGRDREGGWVDAREEDEERVGSCYALCESVH